MGPKQQLEWHQRRLLARSIRNCIADAIKKQEHADRHLQRAASLTTTLLWCLDPFNHDTAVRPD